MADRRALKSDLHRGGRFWISTPDNIPLCQLWEKHRHNNGKMPGLVKQGNLCRQKFPSWQTVGKEVSAYTHAIPSWGNGVCTSGYQGLYESCTSRRTLWGSHHWEDRKEKGQGRHCRNAHDGDYNLFLSLSHSLPLSLSSSSPLFLFLSPHFSPAPICS